VKYRERDDYQRWLFIRWIRELIARCLPVYFLDECGVDHRLYNPYARAPRGERVYAEVHGSRRGRTLLRRACPHAPYLSKGARPAVRRLR